MTTKDTSPPPDSGWDEPADSEPETVRSSVGAIFAGISSHGARVMLDGSGTMFRVLADARNVVELVLYSIEADVPKESRRIRMSKHGDGFHVATVPRVAAGTLYAFALDGEGPFPDPASRFQPFGVHGPSQVMNLAAFQWSDGGWRGRAIEELIIYELHVGTATVEGTFRALIGKLDQLAAMGITAIELMPIGDFPGDRNWGYDGVAMFAPARCYGTPADLAALVDAAHGKGLAVILDVVFNHLGPDGNHLAAFSKRYFTSKHTTPWGDALNFDGADSEPVRVLVQECAAHWIRDYHIDGLRLDATHAMIDQSSSHVLTAITNSARAAASGREVLIIAEDERNEARVVREVARGGLGLDAVWADDFHHEVRRIVAGDDEGYYADFSGELSELVKILQKGWLYEGQRSNNLGKSRGSPCFDIPPSRFVHCLQNHDQIGNRARGDRLHHHVELARVRAATALLLSTPFTPLLFMGQEFGATTPFAYFTDHTPALGKLVTEGRRNEFKKFRAFGDDSARAEIPDPQDPATFERSKLDWSEAERSPGRELFALHRALLTFRKLDPQMKRSARGDVDVDLVGTANSDPRSRTLIAVRRRGEIGRPSTLYVVGLTAGGRATMGASDSTSPGAGRRWSILLDTESKEYGGAGQNASLDGDALTLVGAGAVVLKALPQR